MRDMTVVVFGGSGFIGSHLVAQLAERGRARDRADPARRARQAPDLRCPASKWSRPTSHAEPPCCADCWHGADAAINLVGVLHSQRGAPYGPEFARAHVELPRRIVAACAAAGVPRYLHMSALGADRDGPSMYQRSKADGEVAARAERVGGRHHLPAVGGVRPGRQFPQPVRAHAALLPVVPLACAGAEFQPVYVGDVAQAFVHALRDPKTAPPGV